MLIIICQLGVVVPSTTIRLRVLQFGVIVHTNHNCLSQQRHRHISFACMQLYRSQRLYGIDPSFTQEASVISLACEHPKRVRINCWVINSGFVLEVAQLHKSRPSKIKQILHVLTHFSFVIIESSTDQTLLWSGGSVHK